MERHPFLMAVPKRCDYSSQAASDIADRRGIYHGVQSRIVGTTDGGRSPTEGGFHAR
jgi:hypothetical protein